MKFIFFLITCFSFLLILSGCSLQRAGEIADLQASKDATASPFVHVEGRKLVDANGNEVKLRGIAFGNQVWQNPRTVDFKHHSKIDYKRISNIGFNSVRFYINYQLFEDDNNPYHYKEAGFEWLEKNIAWAKEYGVYLIINMHVPQGGFQSLGDGDALWKEPKLQKRFIALWKEIAARYANESQILGFDLLNEPVVTEDISQWEELANATIFAIREVDQNHIIIVERVNAVKGEWNWNINGEMNFFLVNDRNTMYEFHFYNPMRFTHQGAGWIDGLKEVRTSYPDSDYIEALSPGTWKWASFWNPTLPEGTNKNYHLEGVWYRHDKTDNNYNAKAMYSYIHPVIQVQNIGTQASITLTEAYIEERDTNNTLIKRWTLNTRDKSAWSFWSSNRSGDASVTSSGVTVKGTTNDSVMKNDKIIIALKKGRKYKISGTVSGVKVPANADVRLRIDFYTSVAPPLQFDRHYIEQSILLYTEFGNRYNVPLYLGEFGASYLAFEDERGGASWVRDVILAAEKKGVHINYHTYHEFVFGLFRSNPATKLPSQKDINQKLLDTFIETFAGEQPDWSK